MLESKASILMPLDVLALRLQAAGFVLSTPNRLDMQRIVANWDPPEKGSFRYLKYELAPVLCRNKEEQDKFYRIFDEYEADIKNDLWHQGLALKKNVQPPAPTVPQPWWARYAKIFIGVCVAVTLLLIGKVILNWPPTGHPALNISIQNSSLTKGYDLVGDTILLNGSLSNKADTAGYSIKWHLPDRTVYANWSPRWIARSSGVYTIKAVATNRKTGKQITDSTSVYALCEVPPIASITQIADSGSDRQTYRANVSNANEAQRLSYTYQWYVDGQPAGEGEGLAVAGRSNRDYSVRLHIDTHGAHCSADTLGASFEYAPAAQLVVEGSGSRLPKADIRWGNLTSSLLLLLGLPMVAGVGMYRFLLKKKRTEEAKKALEKSPEIVAPTTGPYLLHLPDTTGLITAQVEVAQLAEVLRKRHVTDVYNLHIPKTIRATIGKGGFPALRFVPRTQPGDYLVLLDVQQPDAHITHLFRYLVQQLQNEQVNLVLYTYNGEPRYFTNEALNHYLLSLDKLAALYPSNIMLLLGSTHGLLQTFDNSIKSWVKIEYRPWNTRIIFTPKPARDWGIREKMLFEAGFTVVPADYNAHVLVEDELNKLIDRQKLKRNIVPGTYKALSYNYQRWRQLEAYVQDVCLQNLHEFGHSCQPNHLLQWVAATAVYPAVSWNFTIALGMALEKAWKMPGNLVNFTNLLAISRIQWMNDGDLSDSLRVEMLYHLEERNEVIARETLIDLLQQTAEELPEKAAAKAELTNLRLTNTFVLHSRPHSHFVLDNHELEQLKEMVSKDQLDWATETYLNQDTNTILKDDTGNAASLHRWKQIWQKQDNETQAERKRQHRNQRLHQIAAITGAIGITLLAALGISGAAGWLQWQNPYRQVEFIISTPQDYETPLTTLAIKQGDNKYVQYVDASSNLVFDSLVAGENASITLTAGSKDFTADLEIDTARYHIVLMRQAAKKLRLSIHYYQSDSLAKILMANLGQYFTVKLVPEGAQIDTLRLISTSGVIASNLDIVKDALYSVGLGEPLWQASPQSASNDSSLSLYVTAPSITIVGPTVQPAALPIALYEIWVGQASQRLVTLDPLGKVLYYATEGKDAYGSYRIAETYQVQNDMYQIILNGNSEYRVAYASSIRSQQFSFAMCPMRFPTAEAARKATAEVCGPFYDMRLYYPQNSEIVYLPLQPQSLTPGEAAKLKKWSNLASVPNNNQAINGSMNWIRNTFWSRKSFGNFELTIAGLPQGIRNSQPKMRNSFNGGPFDRDYMQLFLSAPPTAKVPNCDITFYSVAEALKEKPEVICRIDLSKQDLTSLPIELRQFSNLQVINLGATRIPEREILDFKKRYPKVAVEFVISAPAPNQDNTNNNTPVAGETSLHTYNNFASIENSDVVFERRIAELFSGNAAGKKLKIVAYYSKNDDQSKMLLRNNSLQQEQMKQQKQQKQTKEANPNLPQQQQRQPQSAAPVVDETQANFLARDVKSRLTKLYSVLGKIDIAIETRYENTYGKAGKTADVLGIGFTRGEINFVKGTGTASAY
jgi:hypothetical protein